MKKQKKYLILIILFSLFTPNNSIAFSEKLFFIGEDLEVLTIASRHPENPKEAPAIAEVITSKKIEDGPFITLADVLKTEPGIWIENRENTYYPKFRGITDGFLLLYDGIPLTSDSTKSVYHLGEELNLGNIERIEIVRGPGSVLWGPDAFAGLINIVPKTKKNEIEIYTGSPKENFGFNIFLSKNLNNTKNSFSFYYYEKEPLYRKYSYQIGEKEKRGHIKKEKYYDLYFNINWKDSIKLSGRLSKFKRPFVMKDIKNVSWPGERKNPISFLKLDTKNKINSYTIRTRFYYEYLFLKEKELSLDKKEKNHIFYGEAIIDKPFNNYKGLITIGGSFRKNYVKNATIRIRGFLPDFINPQNESLRPLTDIADFDTNLISLFSQLKYKINKKTFWVGLRLDDHNQYNASTSYQIGTNFRIKENFYIKLIYGTAYRTPYSAQFLEKSKLDNPEKIESLNMEFFYKKENCKIFITPFFNKIKDHISEDYFGGYSYPLKRKFLGIESGINFRSKNLEINGSLSYINSWGEKEKYKVLDYIILIPGEEPQKYYSIKEKPFIIDPKYYAKLDLKYKLEKLSLFTRMHYIGPRKYFYLKDEKTFHFNPDIIIDLSIKYKIKRNIEFSTIIKNMTNRKLYHSGTFSPIKSYPFSIFLKVSKKW